jgi:hypothetical protein
MQKINVHKMPEQERHSPGGKFGAAYKEISIALGRDKNSLDLDKRHPFDLMLARIQRVNRSVLITRKVRSGSSTSSSAAAGSCAMLPAPPRSPQAIRFSSSPAKRTSSPRRLTKSSSTT